MKYSISGVRAWATYYGGGENDIGRSCVTDVNGDVYLAGFTNSTTGIATGGYQNTYGGGMPDAFLVKFNNSGVRQWATYYGGSGEDYGHYCATDSSGNVYLAGYTESTTRIASGGYQNTYGGGNNDAFLVKFNSIGARLWATYYGGNSNDFALSCVTDRNGNVYLAGYTGSTNGIASSSGHQNNYGGGTYDAYLAKFNSSGILQWATYYGGSGIERFSSCSTDGSGNVYLAGATSSTNSIAFGGHQSSYGGGSDDAYLVKFNTSGVRQWATYYGKSGQDIAYSCTTDGNGYVYLAGFTGSTSGMTYVGYQNIHGGGYSDAFLAKFDENSILQWATYYGGRSDDAIYSCTTDRSGNLYLAGFTESVNGIAAGGHQNTYGGDVYDAFLVKFKQPRISGFVWQDLNINCTKDTSESGTLNGLSIVIQPGNYVAQSTGGVYYIDSLPAGTYTVTVDTSNLNWVSTCPTSQTFTVTDPNAGQPHEKQFSYKEIGIQKRYVRQQ